MKILIHSSPTYVFRYLEEDPEVAVKELSSRFLKQARDLLLEAKPLPKRVLQSAAVLPEVPINLGPELAFANPQLSKLIKSNGLVALLMLVRYYNKLAPKLEAVVTMDGQLTFELLRHASKHGIKLRQPIEYYETCILKDPYFANIYDQAAPGRKILSYYSEVTIKEAPMTAADAFIHLTVAKSKNTKIANSLIEQCSELLHEHPLYALIGSTVLKTMGVNIDARKIKNLTARYAVPILRYGVIENSDFLLERIINDPLWGAHYVLSCGSEIQEKEIREIHARMKDIHVDDYFFRVATKAIINYLKGLNENK